MSADRLFVKLCGLRDADSARVAVEAGADALGFILAPSRRQVSPTDIRAIRDELGSVFETLPPIVGVVVNESSHEIERLVAESGIDMVQLAGDESPDVLDEIDVPVVKAFRFDAETTFDEALRRIDPWVSAANPVQHVHVEGHAIGQFGGAGARVDWELAAGIAERFPILLAGGLDPDNVVEAVDRVKPFGVDVSSGTETDGAKDPAKLRAFVANARSAGCSDSGQRCLS